MSDESYDLRVERIMAAPPQVLYDAWTRPELLKQWLGAEEGWSVPVAEVDLRVGGAYRWGIRSPDAGTFYEVGVFTELRPPERLVYTCRYEADECDFDMPAEEMLVTVTFEPLGTRTRVVVEQAGYLRERDRDEQRNGWPSFLAQLAKLVEAAAR